MRIREAWRVIFNRRAHIYVTLHDLVIVALAWVGAYWLRFDIATIQNNYVEVLEPLPLLLLIQGSVFGYLGLYRGLWHFTSLPDILRIIKAVAIGTALSAVTMFLFSRLAGVPRLVLPIFALLLLLGLAGMRMCYRLFSDRQLHLIAAHQAQRVLVVGAGHAGKLLVNNLISDPSHGYRPVVFVDDDPQKNDREIMGIRVISGIEHIPRLVRRYHVDTILLAQPALRHTPMSQLFEACNSAGAPLRVLPLIHDIASGKASMHPLRKVSAEDLLRRKTVVLDQQAIMRGLRGRTILITGGGGSIGAELCRQLLKCSPQSLIVVDNSEFNLYTIDSELRQQQAHAVALLADVCDAVAMRRVFARYRPDLVFHAAAYKHVPMLEVQEREAVRVNVFGTECVARLADEYGADGFVLISTDKAVHPVSAMGASKRIAELLCQSQWTQASRTPPLRMITVRFGNVLNSAGSVLPLFRQQIAAGGPVTVTDPRIKRYFMTIPEACQLIMEACAISSGGEIFVLDMGEPVAIDDLARQMIQLSGLRPMQDIAIHYIGLRAGEKLFEELLYDEEISKTPHDGLLLTRPSAFDNSAFADHIAALRKACDDFDDDLLRARLSLMVPGFRAPQAQTITTPSASA